MARNRPYRHWSFRHFSNTVEKLNVFAIRSSKHCLVLICNAISHLHGNFGHRAAETICSALDYIIQVQQVKTSLNRLIQVLDDLFVVVLQQFFSNVENLCMNQ